MDDLYNKKYQYDNLIKTLNINCGKLESLLNILKSTRNKINNSLVIDDKFFSKSELDLIISKIEKSIYEINNNFLPQARYQYNQILNELSEL